MAIVGLSLLIFLGGCKMFMPETYGTGYSVEIDISANYDRQIKLYAYCDRFMKGRGFVKAKGEEDISSNVSYANASKRHMWIVFDYVNEEAINDRLERVRIENPFSGYTEPCKSDIDEIADLIYRRIQDRIGSDNVSIKKRRTFGWIM